MKKIYIVLLACLLFSSCTKWEYIDTGISKDHKDKTMYEYFQTDTYNWGILKEMVDKAGMAAIFKGEDPEHEKIMFLGPVDNSLRKWMWDNGYETVEDVPADLCETIVSRYVFDKVYAREEVPVGEMGTGDDSNKGGVWLKGLAGNDVWFYSEKSAYNGISDLLVTSLFAVMDDIGEKAFIASSGINVKNGVVHSLDDTHKIGDIVGL